jgi:hypothetical protein
MKYTAEIQRVSDLRTIEMPGSGDFPEILSWWTGGGGKCDCNRSLYFYRAIGEPDPLDAEDCSNQGLFRVRITCEDGTVPLDEMRGKETK